MPEALNQIRWCLNKAKKELAENKKHRGLVEIKPDLQKAAAHLKKAMHNFRAITYFAEGGYSDWSASAAFYVIYHCFLAILAKHGYESRNQECTLAVIQFLKEEAKIKLENKFIDTLNVQLEIKEKHEHTIIEMREDYQYGNKTEMENKERLDKLLKICSEMVEAAKEIIYRV